MKILAFLLRSRKSFVLLAILAGLVSGLSSTLLLGLVNAALARGGSSRGLLWPFLGLCLLVPLTRIASESLLTRLSQDTILQLRLDLSRGLLAVPLRRLEEMGPHRLLAVLTEDVTMVSSAAGVIPSLFVNGAIFLGALGYLGFLSWRVLAVVLLLVCLAIAGYQLTTRRAFRHFHRARSLHDDLYDHLRALTGGLKELKLHGERREAFLTRELEPTARSFRRHNVAGLEILGIAASWGHLLVFVILGALLFGIGPFIGFDTRTLTGYALTLLYIMTPLQFLLNSSATFARAGISLDRVEELGLDLSSEAKEGLPAPAEPPAAAWKSLELVDVTHVYHRESGEGEFLLGPIDLTLHPGELMFIAGGNGSGKTTLAKLLTGLYVPDRGSVRFDGEPVTDANRERYRQRFAAVFSDFHLFQGLLGLEGRPDLDGLAGEYLEVLHLSRKVRVENGRFSSTDLSQGQRKRLALLTAYLEDRSIYLFDEWAADQDPVFKEVFYRQILPSLKAHGKAAVVISHDDRYYDVADVLIRLDDGKIVDEPGRRRDEDRAAFSASAH